MPQVLVWAVYGVYSAILLYVSWVDLRTKRIPNVVVGPAIVLALLMMPWTIGVRAALLGAVLGPLPLIIARVVAGASKMGMGDIKLALFVGLILGNNWALFGVAIGLVLSLAAMGIGTIVGRFTLQSKLPFGPFLAAGTLPLLLLIQLSASPSH